MKYFTVCDGPHGDAGLLFSDTAASTTVADEPFIRELFSNGFFSVPISRASTRGWYSRKQGTEQLVHTLVCPNVNLPMPDEAPLGAAPVVFYKDGEKIEVNLRQRYNQCLSLFKAVGCNQCPEKGLPCLSEGAGRPIGQNGSAAIDSDDLLEKLKKTKPEIGGYAFVHPSLTKRKTFSKAIRSWWEHSFDEIDSNKKELSRNSSNAAQTKKFKKTYCSVCPIQSGCDRARSCKGPYPRENVLIQESVAALNEVVKTSPLKPWQIWELNARVGDRAKHSRWEVVLMGVQYKKDVGLVPCVFRAKTSIVEYQNLKTYEDIAAVFNLATKEEDAAPAPTDQKRLALWWQALQLHGWGKRGWAPRFVIGAAARNEKVSVHWAHNRYLGWDTSLFGFGDISSQISYGRLPGADQEYVR